MASQIFSSSPKFDSARGLLTGKMSALFALSSAVPVAVAVGFCLLAYHVSYLYKEFSKFTREDESTRALDQMMESYVSEEILEEELLELKDRINRKCTMVSDEAHKELEAVARELRWEIEEFSDKKIMKREAFQDLYSDLQEETHLEIARVETTLTNKINSLQTGEATIKNQLTSLQVGETTLKNKLTSLQTELEHVEKQVSLHNADRLVFEANSTTSTETLASAISEVVSHGKIENVYQGWVGTMKEKDLSVSVTITRRCLATKDENLKWIESSKSEETASRDVFLSIHDAPTAWNWMTQTEDGIQISKNYWHSLWTGGIVVKVSVSFPKALILETAGLQFNMDLAKENYPGFFPQSETGILPIVGPAHLQAKRVSLEVFAKEILRKSVSDGKITWTRVLLPSA